MKLQIRVFFSLFLTLSIIFYFFVDFVKNDIGKRYVESVEESLNDTAYILASLVETEIEDNNINSVKLDHIFKKTLKKRFHARIYDLSKNRVDLNVYVFDSKGIIIFDSDNDRKNGKNYSEWNDIYLTLQGKYGARLSIDENGMEYLYVAAPIKQNNKIIGGLTVVKSKESIETFKIIARKKIFTVLLIAFVLFLILIFITSFWITEPIYRLTNYVRSIKTKKRHKLPNLGKTEIGELGIAFEEILTELEGKKYIEQYVQSFTHEIKSPLSSIRGAAELLQEKLPEIDRKKFINNIKSASIRIENIVTKLLELSSLENRNELRDIEKIKLYELINDIIKILTPQIQIKQLTILNNIDNKIVITGEQFLIRHCFSNIIENAIKFSFESGTISIVSGENDKYNIIKIIDEGSGIPEYAINKIFDRFFSLPKKGSNKKSTGLGLSFVKEVILLHNGKICIENNQKNGVTVTASLLKKII